MLFVGFRRAYDTIVRKKLCEALRKLGVPASLLKMTLTGPSNKIQVDGQITGNMTANKGVQQGDPLLAHFSFIF